MIEKTAVLRRLLQQPGLIQAPGCYDAFSARLVQRAGFDVAYMTGFGASASVLGLPDTGYMSFAEVLNHARNMAAAIEIPLIADADTGYGNAMNVFRTVRAYAHAGIAAVQLEDQVAPKKCGHTKGKAVISLPEAAAKIRAAVDARAEHDIVIIARTDARAIHGVDDALARCRAFEDAGADVIFFEAPESSAELQQVRQAISAPLLANLVEGGKTPFLGRAQLEALGIKLAIYPVSLLLGVAKTMQGLLADLKAQDHFDPFARQASFEELKTLVGFDEYYAMEDKYAV